MTTTEAQLFRPREPVYELDEPEQIANFVQRSIALAINGEIGPLEFTRNVYAYADQPLILADFTGQLNTKATFQTSGILARLNLDGATGPIVINRFLDPAIDCKYRFLVEKSIPRFLILPPTWL